MNSVRVVCLAAAALLSGVAFAATPEVDIHDPAMAGQNGSYYFLCYSVSGCGHDMAAGGGTALVSENPKWAGWGGQSVYSFGGKDYVVMHAYEAADNNFHRLKILAIAWDAAGWPAIDGATLDRFHTTLKQ